MVTAASTNMFQLLCKCAKAFSDLIILIFLCSYSCHTFTIFSFEASFSPLTWQAFCSAVYHPTNPYQQPPRSSKFIFQETTRYGVQQFCFRDNVGSLANICISFFAEEWAALWCWRGTLFTKTFTCSFCFLFFIFYFCCGSRCAGFGGMFHLYLFYVYLLYFFLFFPC